ncbi:hypothetical protein B0H13DRAFT_1880412 [Mycena leptocephala]|nr:hypothetical protein B0H13DRAFT_1880412 [Mycena leptocephala]
MLKHKLHLPLAQRHLHSNAQTNTLCHNRSVSLFNHALSKVMVFGLFYLLVENRLGTKRFNPAQDFLPGLIFNCRKTPTRINLKACICCAFPRFRLMDLAALPENGRRVCLMCGSCSGMSGIVRRTRSLTHTDDCDADAIRSAYNITGESVLREEPYQYKYLLDVDGNTPPPSPSSSRCGSSRSSIYFVPVRPDLADLPAEIEWARVNDGEAYRIQESGRIFAERVLTDAQNDCYWFAVLLECGALWVCSLLWSSVFCNQCDEDEAWLYTCPGLGQSIEAGQQDPSLAHESVHVVSNGHH